MEERPRVRCILGPHPLMDSPGAIAEIPLHRAEHTLNRLNQARKLLSWGPEPVLRRHRQGVTLALPSPPDLVDPAADLLEWAAGDDEELDWVVRRIRRAESPALRSILHTFPDAAFSGDGLLTVGLGKHARSWPLDGPLPALNHPSQVARVPTAMITGTNGKTTTTRLLAQIVRSSGRIPGASTSGGVVIGEDRVEPGDWTGPGGARRVLRDPRVDVALLETARGGILRRGLAIQGHDVAVLTNVTPDHIGEWGVDSLEEMAAVKLIIADALRKGGTLVVPAQSEPIWAVLPALLKRRPDIRVQRFSSVGPAEAWSDGRFVIHGDARIPIAEIPITFSGTARHNVENVLAALLAALALGIPGQAINQGLRAFRPSTADNPGRMNCFRLPSGAIVVLDVAHSPDAMQRIVETVKHWPQTRRTLLLGQTGDRPDSDMRDLAIAGTAFGGRILLKEMPTKLFDRRPGDVSRLMAAALRSVHYPEHLMYGPFPTEEAGIRRALQGLGREDVAILLIHESLVTAVELLQQAGAVPVE